MRVNTIKLDSLILTCLSTKAETNNNSFDKNANARVETVIKQNSKRPWKQKKNSNIITTIYFDNHNHLLTEDYRNVNG